jgi:ubiquinone/menaquinone biosynthesis C-methylase UbiE
METKFLTNTTSSNTVSNQYGRLASTYDFFTGYEIAHHKKAIEMADIKSTDTILEVACGTGQATMNLIKAIDQSQTIQAIDLTEQMITKAKKKVERHGFGSYVEFHQGNAKNLPFENDSFDILYNSFMFDLLDQNDFLIVLKEFKRVLKPGGKLVLVNMSKDEEKKRTIYEKLYDKGWINAISGNCRPVMMKPFVEEAGFKNSIRLLESNQLSVFGSWTKTEIVIAYKPIILGD